MKFPIVYVVVCFIAGVYLDRSFQINFAYVSIGSFFFLVLLYLSKIMANRQYNANLGYKSIVIVMGVLCGVISHHIHNRIPANHISHFWGERSAVVSGKVKTILRPSSRYHKYILEVDYMEKVKNVTGNILVYIPKKNFRKKISIEDRIYFNQKCMPIAHAQNPYQFDYANYMKNKRVYHQVFLKQDSFQVVQSKDFSIFRKVSAIKNKITYNLKSKGFVQDELGIIVSLVMGNKSKVSKDLLSDYSSAGAIHVLAVSGLHVGIVYLILTTLLGFLKRIKRGNYILLILLLITMWAYAIFTGLSASVTRAVIMLSFVAIGKQLSRVTNMYNTLAVSAFLLLLYNPNYIFEVGFQLSYLAVLSIVYIHEVIEKIYTPKYQITNYFWQITCISVSVQIGTFPISVYYFHQFPILFIITNWVLIPIIGVILSFGLITSVLSYFEINNIIFTIYGHTIKLMNTFISFMASMEDYIIKDIYLNIPIVILLYLFIHFTIKMLKCKSAKYIYLTAISIICIQSYVLCRNYLLHTQNELVIFHQKGSSIAGIKNGPHLKLLTNSKNYNHSIQGYKLRNNIQELAVQSIEKMTFLSETNLLIVGGKYRVENFIKPLPAKNILLINSTNYDLNNLINSTKPSIIIADGSSSFRYKNRWKKICKSRNVKFHDTQERGFLAISY